MPYESTPQALHGERVYVAMQPCITEDLNTLCIFGVRPAELVPAA